MVHVGAKSDTHRIALAEGTIRMKPETLALVEQQSAKKGDVIGIARIAAIMGAKRTGDRISLCHPLALTRVAVDFDIDRAAHSIHCQARVETHGKTGVEMEALTGCTNWVVDHLRHVQGSRPRHGDDKRKGAGKTWRKIRILDCCAVSCDR